MDTTAPFTCGLKLHCVIGDLCPLSANECATSVCFSLEDDSFHT